MGVEQSMRPAELRRRFLLAFRSELKIVWPILTALVAFLLALCLLVDYREGWFINDAAYFTFVTGLTIVYGDLVPANFGTRLIAIMIGLIGILLTGLVAAVVVRALLKATE